MTWRVDFSEKAARQLSSIHEPDHARIIRRIGTLKTHPHPPGAVAVQGTPYLRLRIGDWRVLYEIDGTANLVRVAYVLRRNEGTYSRLS